MYDAERIEWQRQRYMEAARHALYQAILRVEDTLSADIIIDLRAGRNPCEARRTGGARTTAVAAASGEGPARHQQHVAVRHRRHATATVHPPPAAPPLRHLVADGLHDALARCGRRERHQRTMSLPSTTHVAKMSNRKSRSVADGHPLAPRGYLIWY